MVAHNLSQVHRLKAEGEKITCLTAYDASFARLLVNSGVDMLMVGDSLGMVIQGNGSTVPVNLDAMVYHAANVRRGAGDEALVIVDMPFMSYHKAEIALANAARLFQQGLASMVKLEGGEYLAETVDLLCREGMPVCAHLGLTPQSVHKLGGFRVRGKDSQEAARIEKDALVLQQAGADLLVLECIPSTLGDSITQMLKIPTIGIGAGPRCDGQVLVSYDMLGITQTRMPRFVKNYMEQAGSMEAAVRQFVDEVKNGVFPGEEHGY